MRSEIFVMMVSERQMVREMAKMVSDDWLEMLRRKVRME